MSEQEINSLQRMSYGMKQSGSETGEAETFALRKTSVDEWKEFNDNQVVALRIEQFIMYATLLNEQQDLYAKNKTLTENQDIQLELVQRILSDFHNKGYGSMREFQSLDYNLHYKDLQISTIKYTVLLASIIFLMIGMTMIGLFNQTVTATASSILLMIYLLILILQFKQNQIRRKYDWNKIYWKSPVKPQKNADTCKFLGLF
uniref:Uncharacterized protein n=1 Tax=viral metagenome TaxID=1070528 RepID=A0A6C0CUU6_9ZZZZ